MKLAISVFSVAEYEFEVKIDSQNLKVKIPVPFIFITKVVGSKFDLY